MFLLKLRDAKHSIAISRGRRSTSSVVGRNGGCVARSLNFLNLSRVFTPVMQDICFLASSSGSEMRRYARKQKARQ
jgi:hypothetical protein